MLKKPFYLMPHISDSHLQMYILHNVFCMFLPVIPMNLSSVFCDKDRMTEMKLKNKRNDLFNRQLVPAGYSSILNVPPLSPLANFKKEKTAMSVYD